MSDKMIDQFKNFDDLSAFARAQQKTLVELTKKNKKYEEEIKHLKKLLEGAVPVIASNKPIEFGANDEESIAREQLFRLKQLSTEKELTLEEAKRVEIFVKILTGPKDKMRTIEAKSKNLSDNELLKLLPGSNDDASTK